MPTRRFTPDMFARLVGESLARNPRRKLLTAAALVVGMAVATATLTIALDVGDRMSREFRSLGANLLVTPQADTLPLEIGGIDYRPVNEGAYLPEADLGKLKMIFWRHNILGFTPFLDVPASITTANDGARQPATLIGTWYDHAVPVPDGTVFKTGAKTTHPWWNIRGRWFADGSKECVVGATLAAAYPGGIHVGQTINIAGQSEGTSGTGEVIPLLVTGIVVTGGPEDSSVLAPLGVAQKLSNHPGQIRQLFVSALTKPADSLAERDPKTMTPAEYDQWFCAPYISSISFQIRQVLPGTDVRTIRRVADSEGRILSRVSTLLWVVTIAALVAAGLAVAATSAATILDRQGEIGIMKAIGATNTLVAGIFLAEQATLALAGGAVGFIFGGALARVLGASVFGTPAQLHVILLPVAIGLALVVAILGSLFPLRRASHLDPAPILRGE